MGELARRYRAQSLWVSHGQVAAMVVAGLGALALAFVLGLVVGRNRSLPGHAQPAPSATTGDTLIQVLARVESKANPHGEVEQLTFPNALVAPQGPALTPNNPHHEPLVLVVDPPPRPNSVLMALPQVSGVLAPDTDLSTAPPAEITSP